MLLQDVKDFVDALQMGVSSSFDDNGLTPIPSKVQEAVQSCAELRVTADRAQGGLLATRCWWWWWRCCYCSFVFLCLWRAVKVASRRPARPCRVLKTGVVYFVFGLFVGKFLEGGSSLVPIGTRMMCSFCENKGLEVESAAG